MEKDLSLDVTNRVDGYGHLESDIKRALRKALNIMDKRNVLVEVSLLSKEDISDINKTYRSKEGPTNVISIPDPEEMPEVDTKHLGEIYLCPEIIEERREDIIYLAIHGLLHLLGYTHKDKSDTMKMEEKEKELLDQIKEN